MLNPDRRLPRPSVAAACGTSTVTTCWPGFHLERRTPSLLDGGSGL